VIEVMLDAVLAPATVTPWAKVVPSFFVIPVDPSVYELELTASALFPPTKTPEIDAPVASTLYREVVADAAGKKNAAADCEPIA
jgi:hypothetical protein